MDLPWPARARRPAGMPSLLPLLVLLTQAAAVFHGAAATVPVTGSSNLTYRIAAANLTGNSQRYEDSGIRLLQGLRPDIIALQEFNYSNNTPAQLRAFVTAVAGSNAVFFREANSGYSLPNGIISRWPIAAAGSWDDPQLANRGFAWARIRLPGTQEVVVVSVHLHSGGGATSRAIEATVLRSNLVNTFPAGTAWVIAGDLNTDTRTEACLDTLRTITTDQPVPNDGATPPDSDTNQGRTKPYDHILPALSLAANQVPTVIAGRSFPAGLVFDSRVFTPLAGVAPIQTGDSGAQQHMAVVKDFRTTVPFTNQVPLPPVRITLGTGPILRWQSLPSLTFQVESSTNPPAWFAAGTATSVTTNYAFQPPVTGGLRRFWRVRWP